MSRLRVHTRHTFITLSNHVTIISGILRNFVRGWEGGGGVQQIQLRTEDRENSDLGAVAPIVRCSGGSCNLVKEISFHIVKCS